MAFSDLQLKVASEAAVLAAERYITPVKVFAKDFSPRAGAKFGAVAVPVFDLSAAGEFNETTNNWCNGEGINGAVVQLEKQFIKQVKLTDVQNGETDINLLRDGSEAIARKLGAAVEKYVMDTIAAGATGATQTVALSAINDSVAGLHAGCAAAGVDPYDSVLVLSPDVFGKLLANVPYNILGSQEAVKYGLIYSLYGFKGVVQGATLSANTGYIVPTDSIALASRYNAPVVDGYAATWQATDEKTGLTFGYRYFEHLCGGYGIIAGDVLMGAKVVQPTKILPISAA